MEAFLREIWSVCDGGTEQAVLAFHHLTNEPFVKSDNDIFRRRKLRLSDLRGAHFELDAAVSELLQDQHKRHLAKQSIAAIIPARVRRDSYVQMSAAVVGKTQVGV